MKIMELELDSLDLKYAGLRARRPTLEKRLVASMGETGQQSPVIVVPTENGKHLVIDGHKRVRYYGTAGREGRRKMLEDPARFLKAWEATQGEALGALSAAEGRCLKNLELIGHISFAQRSRRSRRRGLAREK